MTWEFSKLQDARSKGLVPCLTNSIAPPSFDRMTSWGRNRRRTKIAWNDLPTDDDAIKKGMRAARTSECQSTLLLTTMEEDIAAVDVIFFAQVGRWAGRSLTNNAYRKYAPPHKHTRRCRRRRHCATTATVPLRE